MASVKTIHSTCAIAWIEAKNQILTWYILPCISLYHAVFLRIILYYLLHYHVLLWRCIPLYCPMVSLLLCISMYYSVQACITMTLYSSFCPVLLCISMYHSGLFYIMLYSSVLPYITLVYPWHWTNN